MLQVGDKVANAVTGHEAVIINVEELRNGQRVVVKYTKDYPADNIRKGLTKTFCNTALVTRVVKIP